MEKHRYSLQEIFLQGNVTNNREREADRQWDRQSGEIDRHTDRWRKRERDETPSNLS